MVNITRDQMVKMYTQMTEIKEMQKKAYEIYMKRMVRGRSH